MLRPSMRWALGLVICLLAAQAYGWDGSASPHDGQGLAIAGPGAWRDGDGRVIETIRDAQGLMTGQVAPLTQGMSTTLTVRRAGDYTLWLRLGQARGHQTPVAVRITDAEGAAVLEGTINQDQGAAEQGGPRGYHAYTQRARATAPDGRSIADDAGLEGPSAEEAFADDLVAELEMGLADPAEAALRRWAHMRRVEEIDAARPYHWWKLDGAALEPGEYTLTLRPLANVPAEHEPRVDAVFATTFDNLAYPYIGDIDAPPASYVRFRIDSMADAAAGATLSASVMHHRYPTFSTSGTFNADSNVHDEVGTPHTQTGYTRWYRLQDIEYMPEFGGAEISVWLKAEGAEAGRTEFAVFPHDDRVLRSFDWREPSGMAWTMMTDFQTHLHRLRTHRDHARENYEHALAAARGRLYPLTRGGLIFTNGWGQATGAAHEYMAKTLRLLGMNATATTQPTEDRERYGWANVGGHYWPPGYMPYDEGRSRRQYDDYYADYFKDRERFEHTAVFQIADEPGEIAREAMSAPIWRLEGEGDEQRYVDHTGNSTLTTARMDLSDCVIEGAISRQGAIIEFRLAVSGEGAAQDFTFLRVGQIHREHPKVTVAVGKKGDAYGQWHERPQAKIAATATPFKIVYESGRAALYLDGNLVHQISDLPATGGFAIAGPPKTVHDLRLRTIAPDEHIVAANAGRTTNLTDGNDFDDLGLDALEAELADEPDWVTRKPFARAVREDWRIGGAIPGAHEGFRKWLAARGIEPGDIGAAGWDDVQINTLHRFATDEAGKRLYYWSRRYSAYLTPRMFYLAAEAIRRHAPNKQMRSFVALSGHSLYFPSMPPLDMFDLGAHGEALTPGISDWMSLGGWRWDSHQAVAFSVAPYNAGARRYGEDFGQPPVSFPMMHCVWPSTFRSYTQLANQVKVISYWTYGPSYATTEGYWSDSAGSHHAVSLTNNRAAQVDDILAEGRMRPSRVAMLYARSSDYWRTSGASFADKRAAFLALSHAYYQPELVTEEQVAAGALAHYDALVVLDAWVSHDARDAIDRFVRGGGLVCAYADALRFDEYDQPADWLANTVNIARTFDRTPPASNVMRSVDDALAFEPYTVHGADRPDAVDAQDATVRATYDDGSPAWVEKQVGKGKVVYIAHRPGLTYTSKALRHGGHVAVWADTAREALVQPLIEANIERELTVSEPLIMASPLSTEAGTVIVLYNMRTSRRDGLTLRLREDARPISVQRFGDDGMTLVDQPFDHADGHVTLSLDLAAGEAQMVLIRRAAAAPDDRLERMKARTVAQLESDDWQALLAGAWCAAFFPQWNLAERIRPLLEHEHWAVRRSAAEALGRLDDQASADTLAALVKGETDAHALGDMLLALARLDHPRTVELCHAMLCGDGPDAGENAGHEQAYVRMMAARAMKVYLEAHPISDDGDTWLDVQTANQLHRAMLAAKNDPDRRVRQHGIALAPLVVPDEALTWIVQSYDDEHVESARDRDLWRAALIANDPLVERWLADGMNGPRAMLLDVAARKADARLAAALREALTDADVQAMRAAWSALIVQGDKDLVRALVAQRATLDAGLRGYLTEILDRVFPDIRRGNDLEAWARALAE